MDEKKYEKIYHLTEGERNLIDEEDEFLEDVFVKKEIMEILPDPEFMSEDIMKRIRAVDDAKAERKRISEEQTAGEQTTDAWSRAELSEEDKELLRLGRIYKKKRKSYRYLLVAAMLVLLFAFGITSVGGPEKIFEKVSWMLAGREQVNVDSDHEDVTPTSGMDEEEIYQKIEDVYGFLAVRPLYLPEGIKFLEGQIGEEILGINLIYGTKEEVKITYLIRPNYKTGSLGTDVEDEVLEEYYINVEDKQVLVKRYLIKDTGIERWSAEFVHQKVHYFMMGIDFEQQEFEEIIKNLFFS